MSEAVTDEVKDIVSHIPTEVMFVGAIYKQPDLIINYGQYIRSKYDFADEVTKFFYDAAEVIYQTRTQTFNKSTISSYFAEDLNRLAQYKKYGGWRTLEQWMKLAIIDDIQNYYDIVKKYSLLREYQRNGFDVSKIITHKSFEKFTASDVYRLIRAKADRIHTVILTNQEAEVLNKGIGDMINAALDKPDMGVSLPFPVMSSLFRGCKLGTVTAVGMLSNAGKTRFMTDVIAHVALVKKQKVFVMLNEMTIDELRLCLLTTCINNKEFQELHGVNIKKCEREISLGLYRDNKGNFIYREIDKDGNFIEDINEYTNRIKDNSEEYRQVMKVANWIESEINGKIFIRDVVSGYDDKSLEFEIRKAKLINNCNMWFYDTCKNDTATMGDWAALKVTVTKLTDLSKELEIFGYLSIQLTDDTEYIKPDELTSMNIAACKNLKHVLHTLTLFKEISPDKYHLYKYIQSDDEWGKDVECELNLSDRYYIGNIDKNRYGQKKKILFRLNLDTNVWEEMGVLIRK